MMDEGEEYYSREDDRDGAPHAYRPITPITPFLALPDDDGVAAVRVVGIRPSVNDPDVFPVYHNQASRGSRSMGCDRRLDLVRPCRAKRALLLCGAHRWLTSWLTGAYG